MKPDKQLRDRCALCGFFHSKKAGKPRKCKAEPQYGCVCCGKMVPLKKGKCKDHEAFERCIIIGCGATVKRMGTGLDICPDGLKHHKLITGSLRSALEIRNTHRKCSNISNPQRYVYSGPRGKPSIRGQSDPVCYQPCFGHRNECKMHIIMQKKLCVCGRVPPDRMFIGMLFHRRIIYRDVFNILIGLLATPMTCYHTD